MKKKITLLAAILLGGSLMQVSAQDHIYDWGYAVGGTGSDSGSKIATDNSGNVIMIGSFQASFDADPGTGNNNLNHVGANDISICKYDTDGNLIWAKSIGGSGNELPRGLDVASDGSVYVSGGFQTTVDFDPGVDEENRISNGDLDIFLLKLDSNGDFQWVYTAGSTSADYSNDLAIDNNGNAYLTGTFQNTVDFDPDLGTSDLTSQGATDGFVLKLDPNGAFTSVYHLGSTSDVTPNSIAVDHVNDVYVSGDYLGVVDLDVANGPQNFSSEGDRDIFLMKLNESGTFSWAHSIGSTGNDNSEDLTIDLDNNIIFGGGFAGTVDFDPDAVDTDNKTSVAGIDIVLAKYDSNGDYIFSATAGGSNNDIITGITVDGNNNIYSSGFFRYTADFDPSATGTQNVSVNCNCVYADQFIWNLDENGNYLFAESIGGTNNDHAIDIHADGAFLYNTGYFNGTIDLDLSSNTASVSSAGGSDMSFSKHFICNPIATTDVITSCSPITWIDGNTYSSDDNTATMMLTNQYGCDSLVTLDFRITTIDDQTVTASDVEFCDDGTPTFELGSSQNEVFYSLVDQSNGTVIDGPTEGTGSPLTLNGGNITTTTTYEVRAETNKNNALTFTGNSATPTHVVMGNDINKVFRNTNQITVEGWVNTNGSSNLQTIAGNYGQSSNTMQFLLRLDNNKATFWVGTGANPSNYQVVIGTTTITQGTWNHVAGTYDGTTLSIYVNGVLENTFAISANLPDIDNNFTIGGGIPPNSEYFSGEITGVRIWNIARSATDIDTDKDQCIAGNTPGLVAMYNMIDGPGSAVLSDESVNGFDGTLTNMDNNTSWNYTNLPSIACQTCSATMTQTPTITVNNSTTGTDVQSSCDSYTWIDGNTYTSSNNTATHTLTNAIGCDSIVTLDLTINTTPTAGATDNGDGTITATGTGSYQWIDCNTNMAITGETSSDFTPTQNGDYKVTVSNGDCADTSDCVTIDNVGLLELDNSELSAYPNPTAGQVTISSSNNLIHAIIILDAAGRKVNELGVNASSTVVDLTNVENGIYFIEVESANQSRTRLKIVKR